MLNSEQTVSTLGFAVTEDIESSATDISGHGMTVTFNHYLFL